MKKLYSILIIAFVLAVGITSCSENETPIVNPLIGSWNVTKNMTITLFLDGQPVSYSEFGSTVFGLNEEEAADYVASWLQNQVLGPLQSDKKIDFRPDNLFIIGTPGELSSQGTFQLFNDNTRLRLIAPGMALTNYDFDVIATGCPALKLRHEATIEIVGAPQQYNYAVDLALTKTGC
jgi:hypothetical protein